MFMILAINGSVLGQQSGSIWIKTYKPGSANYNDATIDKKALDFLDSLMKRDDIVVEFLGGADNLKWKGLPQNSNVSKAFDQAKKLERALELKNRYGKGKVGITNEPTRGVKVVWSPKPPDIFKLQKEVNQLRAKSDSLAGLFANLYKKQNEQFAALSDSFKWLFANNVVEDKKIEQLFFDWEVKTGVLAWTGGTPYDLAVPSVGISLKRQYWAFELSGGFTPWSREDVYGKRGDAMLMGTIALFPEKTIEYRAGGFSGWEFLSKTDNWTMKVMGITLGPAIKWKFFEVFVGYSVSRLSTLTDSDKWINGVMCQFNFKFIIN